MIYTLAAVLSAVLLIKSLSYGVWCIKNEHAPGGVFVLSFCVFSFCFLCFALFFAP